MATDVKGVLERVGLRVEKEIFSRKRGLQYYIKCPQHKAEYDNQKRLISVQVDHEPSCSVSAETGAFKCWSCGLKGSLHRLVRILGGDTADVDEMSKNSAYDRYRAKDVWAGEKPVDVVPMTEARVDMYDEPPRWALNARKITRSACLDFGIRWDAQRDWWVLPIRHPETHKLLGYQEKGETDRSHFHNRPSDVAKGATLFGIDVEFGEDYVVVVESPLDAVRLWSLGIPAVAIMGGQISYEQMELLIARFDTIVLALDNDKTGHDETFRLIGRYPSGKPNRYEQDYSKRAKIRIFDYQGLTTEQAKDPGEMTDMKIRCGVDSAFSPLRLLAA